jgi:hypothetical protein
MQHAATTKQPAQNFSTAQKFPPRPPNEVGTRSFAPFWTGRLHWAKNVRCFGVWLHGNVNQTRPKGSRCADHACLSCILFFFFKICRSVLINKISDQWNECMPRVIYYSDLIVLPYLLRTLLLSHVNCPWSILRTPSVSFPPHAFLNFRAKTYTPFFFETRQKLCLSLI